MRWTDADVARFMKRVDKLPNGCWFWTGARSRGSGNRKWYGSFRVGGHVIRAHRFSCHAIGLKSPLPAGHHRDHTCRFSLCVNPDHLEIVTRQVNQDRKTMAADQPICQKPSAFERLFNSCPHCGAYDGEECRL